MEIKNQVSLFILILAAITTLTESQGFTFPAGFTFPQRPQIPAIPGISGLGLETFCDLKRPPPFKDPSIIDIPPSAFPAQKANAAIRDRPDVAAFRDGNKQLARVRDRARSAARPGPGGGGGVGGGAGGSVGRGKRQTEQKSFLAPTIKESLCVTTEKEIRAVINEGDVCYTFPEDDIKFFDCQTEHANVPNPFPGINRYFCQPENYAFTSFQVFCPNTAELFRFHTVSIPLNCCGRHYTCDFKPYSALTGPRYF